VWPEKALAVEMNLDGSGCWRTKPPSHAMSARWQRLSADNCRLLGALAQRILKRQQTGGPGQLKAFLVVGLELFLSSHNERDS